MIHDDHVIVCIPYYRCQQYIRRAVLSILEQTHRNLTLVVVNDADFETPPWPVLADITDRRLVRFDLRENYGLYFANALVLNATPSNFFLVQDADDWSHPERINLLLQSMHSNNSDMAFCAEVQFQSDIDKSDKVLGIRYKNPANFFNREMDKNMEIFCPFIDASYKFRISHHALFKAGTLKKIGGYYAGLRQHFDTLLTNLILMVGNVSHVNQPLYWRLHWPGSITKHPDTGFGSDISVTTLKKGEEIYQMLYPFYQDYIHGNIDSESFIAQIRLTCANNISTCARQTLSDESNRLRNIIHLN